MNRTIKRIYDALPARVQSWVLAGYGAVLNRERYGGRYEEFRDLLETSQWWKKEELQAYQDARLRELIVHAYDTVPYYRQVFEERGLAPSDIRCRGDLVKLPFLTRSEVVRHYGRLVSRAFPKSRLKTGHTSGTTGSPLTVLYDPGAINMTYASLGRQYLWAGCSLGRDGNRVAVARGNVIVPIARKKPPFWRYNRYHNQLLLSSFHMSGETLPDYFKEMERFRASVIDGYPSTLYILAKHLANYGRTFPLSAVISSSETLYDFQREVIEKSFACRVFDYYALAERVAFAAECEKHEGHHLFMEYGISEIVNGNGTLAEDGKPGKLVGTGLTNLGMPLIRYVTNDITAIREQSCSCGRGLTLMDDVTTKAEDMLTLKDGRIISPSVLTHPFKPLTGIVESQIVQESHDRVVVKIVSGGRFSEEDGNHLIEELEERIGGGVRIEVMLVDQLPRTVTGKFKWVVSKVPIGI